MPWRVEFSDLLGPSVLRFSTQYGVTPNLIDQLVTKFAIVKRFGANGNLGTSDDKPSGHNRGGSLSFKLYRENNIHHCHLDIRGADPMIVYRVVEAERRIRIICITDHREMFSTPKKFAQMIHSELPRGKVRKEAAGEPEMRRDPR